MRNFINIINESIGQLPAMDDSTPDTEMSAPDMAPDMPAKDPKEGFKARLEALMAQIADLKASVVEEDDGMNGATVPQNGSGTETSGQGDIGVSGTETTPGADTSGTDYAVANAG